MLSSSGLGHPLSGGNAGSNPVGMRDKEHQLAGCYIFIGKTSYVLLSLAPASVFAGIMCDVTYYGVRSLTG